MRMWFGSIPAVLLCVLIGPAPEVQAAAEVHRLNLAISAVPTQVRANDFNGMIDDINRIRLAPLGLEPLPRINMSWLFDAELRYFARPHLALTVGVGRLRASTSQEYLPTIGSSNTLRSGVTSIPIHAGAAYYFSPYNQGDFQARAFVGGGFSHSVHNRASLTWDGSGIPAGQAFHWTGTNDGPGYYGELGAHMFFATKLSVMLSGMHRSSQVRNLVDEATGALILNAQGGPISLDAGGTGFRMAIGIGL